MSMLEVFKSTSNQPILTLFANNGGEINSEGEKIEIKVAAIQPNIHETWEWRQEHYELIADKAFNLTKQAVNEGAEIVVWPEYTIAVDFIQYREKFRNKVFKFAKENKVNLVIGTMLYDSQSGDHLDVALYINSFGEIIGRYDSISPASFNQNTFEAEEQKLISFNLRSNKLNVGTAICYEEFFGNIFSDAKKKDSNLFVVLSNNKDVGRGIYLASLYAKFRAAENNVPLIRSANNGISQIIAPNGRIIQELSKNQEGIIFSRISVSTD